MSSSSSSGGPRDLRSRRKEATRAEILAAAQDVFAEQGIHEARMETIAARACVSVGTLYNYFDDRSALVHSLITKFHTDMIEGIDAANEASAGKPFEERLRGFIGAIIEHIQHKRTFMAAILSDASRQAPDDIDRDQRDFRGTVGSMMMEMYKRAETICKEGVAEGVLRAEDHLFYPSMLIGTLRGILMFLVFHDHEARPVTTEVAVRFFLKGASKSRGKT